MHKVGGCPEPYGPPPTPSVSDVFWNRLMHEVYKGGGVFMVTLLPQK